MLYVYIEIRYLRQIKKIRPEIIKNFIQSVQNFAKDNGIVFVEQSGCSIIQSNSTNCGWVFSVARFLKSLNKLLIEYAKDIREFLILVDYAETHTNLDQLINKANTYKTTLYPDSVILSSKKATEILLPYCIMKPFKSAPFDIFIGTKDVLKPKKSQTNTSETKYYHFFITKENNPFFDISLLIDTLPSIDTIVCSKEEFQLYEEYLIAIKVFKKNRFLLPPLYIQDILLRYVQFIFNALAKKQKTSIVVEIHPSAGTSIPSEHQRILSRCTPACTFKKTSSFKYPSLALDAISSDFLELMWLVYNFKDFLFPDEYTDFFAFLGKSKSYFLDALELMHLYGFLANIDDLRTLRPFPIEQIETKLGARVQELAFRISQFLWYNFNKGNYIPSITSYKKLQDLGFEVPDSFIVQCLLIDENFIYAYSADISSAYVREALSISKAAYEAYNAEHYHEAARQTKKALHLFQVHKIQALEYKMLLQTSFILLAQKNIEDAIIYAEYALDVSKQLLNPNQQLVAYFYTAICFYFQNSLYSVQDYLGIAHEYINKNYLKEWLMPLYFLEGRVLFDAGMYENAILLFEKAKESALYISDTNKKICELWALRAKIHCSKKITDLATLTDYFNEFPESHVFYLEALILFEKYQEPLKDLNYTSDFSRVLVIPSGVSLANINNSFSFIENLLGECNPTLNIGQSLFDVFSLYIQTQVAPANQKETLIRDLIACAQSAQKEKNPYTSMYFYFCYELLSTMQGQAIGSPDIYLSKAFKELQVRAKEIGDNTMRESFMQKATWNSLLFKAGKKHNLI